jgi:exonuclease SbcC
LSRLREERQRGNALKEESSDALRALQGEQESSRRQLEELDQEIASQIQDIQRRLGEIREEGEEERQVEELIAARKERSAVLKEQYDERGQEHQNGVTAYQVALADAGNRESTLERAEANHAEMAATCERLLREHGFATIADAADARLPVGELKELRDRGVAMEASLKSAAEQRIILETRLGGRRITDAELLEIEGGYMAAESEHQSAIGVASVARAALDECRGKNAEWHEVAGQNDAATRREGTIARLAKYLQGDAFVNYIADERLDEVCRRASHQLRNLTTGRLELSSRPDDGFYIVDNGNGGIERSPSSLSGGETFLVSLSLALALSDTIQMGRAPLEFFFLDEGFGTLDTELLESVMNSLERLRSQHRTIGVITHVGSLRERITKRLLVTPAGELNGSLVTFEEA